MNQATRIEKDLTMFKENYASLDLDALSPSQRNIVSLADQYFRDAQYYLDKKDFFTAFGCINYAHGLLDAIIKF